jgi:cytochrome d ubiquinol oxidase subunit II
MIRICPATRGWSVSSGRGRPVPPSWSARSRWPASRYCGSDAPHLFTGLPHRGLPLVVASGLAGLTSVVLLIVGRFGLARVAAALAVTAVVWGLAAAQYPYLLAPRLTIAAGAAPRATLVALAVSLVIGGALLVPALALLYTLFQRTAPYPAAPREPG